jgi:hypothetical protein
MPTTCRMCPRELPPPKARGRRRVYCSIYCRREREAELRIERSVAEIRPVTDSDFEEMRQLLCDFGGPAMRELIDNFGKETR